MDSVVVIAVDTAVDSEEDMVVMVAADSVEAVSVRNIKNLHIFKKEEVTNRLKIIFKKNFHF